jgi:hypothetical protein
MIEPGPSPFLVISTYSSVTCIAVLIGHLCSKRDIELVSQSDAISAASLLTCSSPPLSLQTTSGSQVQETAVATQSCIVSGITYLIVA